MPLVLELDFFAPVFFALDLVLLFALVRPPLLLAEVDLPDAPERDELDLAVERLAVVRPPLDPDDLRVPPPDAALLDDPPREDAPLLLLPLLFFVPAFAMQPPEGELVLQSNTFGH